MPRIKSLAAKAANHDTPPATNTPDKDTSPGVTVVPDRTSPTPPTASGKLQEYLVARPVRVEPPGGKVPYVVVYHPIVKKAAAIAQAVPGVQEGQVVVVLADGQILPASKIHLVDARQYWTE